MRSVALLFSAALAAQAGAASLDGFSDADLAKALRAGLSDGATRAVAALGKPDGFLGDPKLRIPLPPALDCASGVLRRVGLGGQLDALVVAMNRAAEAAVPQAKQAVVASIQQLTVSDARAILGGPPDAATQYFARTTRTPLTAQLQPIVHGTVGALGIAQRYDSLVARAARYGLADPAKADLDAWVTRKTLDGLYATIGEQERRLRKDPLRQTSRLLRDVFGALAH